MLSICTIISKVAPPVKGTSHNRHLHGTVHKALPSSFSGGPRGPDISCSFYRGTPWSPGKEWSSSREWSVGLEHLALWAHRDQGDQDLKHWLWVRFESWPQNVPAVRLRAESYLVWVMIFSSVKRDVVSVCLSHKEAAKEKWLVWEVCKGTGMNAAHWAWPMAGTCKCLLLSQATPASITPCAAPALWGPHLLARANHGVSGSQC